MGPNDAVAVADADLDGRGGVDAGRRPRPHVHLEPPQQRGRPPRPPAAGALLRPRPLERADAGPDGHGRPHRAHDGPRRRRPRQTLHPDSLDLLRRHHGRVHRPQIHSGEPQATLQRMPKRSCRNHFIEIRATCISINYRSNKTNRRCIVL